MAIPMFVLAESNFLKLCVKMIPHHNEFAHSVQEVDSPCSFGRHMIKSIEWTFKQMSNDDNVKEEYLQKDAIFEFKI